MTDSGSQTTVPQLRRYHDWLREERGRDFASYGELWSWSTCDLAGFWDSIWAYLELASPTPFTSVVTGEMPKVSWFAGAQVNYAQQVFRHVEPAESAGQPAIVAEDESGAVVEIGWTDLRRRAASLALELRRAGVGREDRVAAYLPNIPEAAIGLLACAAIGAVWTLCSPDMGTPAVLDRLRQVAPKVLLAVDGVVYAGKARDRSAAVSELRRGLPSVTTVLLLRTRHAAGDVADAADLSSAQRRDDAEVTAFAPEWLPFDHPLWILYSSGTTGLPKPIVHGHGGIILTGCVGNMHLDLGPSYAPETLGERFHWYSATGWVMWNIQIGGLLTGATICLYDGAPRGIGTAADWSTLWRYASRHRITWFGAGAAYYESCRKAGLSLEDAGDLRAVRALGSTGSPLTAAAEAWGSTELAGAGSPGIWWCNLSGGTDIAAAFLSGNRELPPAAGRMQCRHLGAAIEAWDAKGRPHIGEVGELVCTRPFPSMPLYLWGDEDRSRYCATYFDRWPGVWRHGDWITVEADGSCSISGRSDATINRHGLRMGTAEIYAAVEALPQVADTLVIDVEDGRGDSVLVMMIVPAAGYTLDDELEHAVAQAIRAALSPRFVPDVFLQAPGVLRTLSGKKQELPVKRLFLGWPLDEVLDPNLIDTPQHVDWYVAAAATWRGHHVDAPGDMILPQESL